MLQKFANFSKLLQCTLFSYVIALIYNDITKLSQSDDFHFVLNTFL